MKTLRMTAAVAAIQLLMAIAGMPSLLMPEAQALRGRGAAFAIGAAAGSASASSAEAEAAAAQQQAAAAQKQAAEAEQQLAAEKARAAATSQPAPASPAAAASVKPLPLGKVVPALPDGCVSTPVDGVNYYYCGGNFYKAVYEGSTLKYVTTKPE